jgi:RNA polymerase sigma-70 factor (ECF subfamily)
MKASGDDQGAERAMAATDARLREWMVLSLAGDQAALTRLLDEAGGRLRIYFTRRLASSPLDVEDLVQEALLAIYAKRYSYDPSLPITPWIYTIARYKLVDHLRRQKHRVTVPLERAGEVQSLENPEQGAIRLDLDRLLGQLPLSRRRLVEDLKLIGLSVPEAAARGGVTPASAKVMVHRSIKRLREACRA